MTARSASVRRWFTDGALAATAALLVVLVYWANPAKQTPIADPSLATALAALRTDPLQVAALRNLGLALDRGGDRADADPLMALAGERSKRDTITALWLLQRALERGQYDAAFDQADALLRRDIDTALRARLYGLLTAASALAPARPALAQRLAARPWWRESFLRELAAKGDPAAGEALLVALGHVGAGSSPEESEAFLARRVAQGEFAVAVEEAERLFGEAVRNPDDVTTPPPVGWSTADGEGASSAVQDGRLAVTYDGFASPELPRRLLALAPGAWTLTFQHRAQDGSAPRLKVEIRCATGATLGQIALPVSASWRAETVNFTVPTNGCEGQWLAIVPDPGERRAAVESDFTAWSIARGFTAPRPR